MRVLVVLHTPRSPHSAVYLGYWQLAEAMADAGHSPTILTPEDFTVCRWLHARWLPLAFPPLVAWRLGRHGAGRDVVVFHSYAGWTANLWPGRTFRSVTAFHGLEPLYYRELAEEMRRCGRPLRWPFRLVHGWLMPRLLRLSCRRSQAVLCLNRTERRYLERHGWAPLARVNIVRHGVDPGFFVARTHAAVVRTLLFVGQWLPMKGTRTLADAFTAVAARRRDLRLCCAGTLMEAGDVRRIFPAECQHQVEVHARVTQTELIDLYRRSDLFLLPSLSEGSSRALLEAMAAALPIVTTPVGAAPELLDADVSALFVPPRDPHSLATALGRLLDDPGLRERLGRAAQAKARQFELTPCHEATLAVLKRVAGSGA